MDNQEELRKQISFLESQLFSLRSQYIDRIDELEKMLVSHTYDEAEKSLFNFYCAAWNEFERVPLKTNWHLTAICEHLDALLTGEIENLIIQVQPRSSKSSICNISFPVYCWLKDPSLSFVSASNNLGLTTRLSKASRRLIESPWFQDRWSDRFAFSRDTNTITRYKTNKGGERRSISVGSAIIGEGFDILSIDDPHIPTHFLGGSDKEIVKVADWYDNDIRPRANPGAKKLVIHQRLGENDLIGHIKKKYLDVEPWEILNLPTEYEPTTYVTCIGWSDPRKEEGELIWPELYPAKSYEAHKKNEYLFAAQYQQRPAPVGGGLIKKDWIKVFDLPINMLGNFDVLIGSWDLTFGDTGSSFCVGQVWGKKGPDKYLLYQDRGQYNIIQQLEQIREMKRRFPGIRAMLVENKANGRAVMDMLKREIPGLLPIEPRELGDKETRMISCAVDFEAGNVWIPSEKLYPWVKEWLHEILVFPKGSTDDQADCTSQALNWLHANFSVSNQVSIDVAFRVLEQEKNPNSLKKEWDSNVLNPVSMGEARGFFLSSP